MVELENKKKELLEKMKNSTDTKIRYDSFLDYFRLNASSEELMLAYSMWAETYDNDYKEIGGSELKQIRLVEKVKEVFKNETNIRILDICCGTGRVSEFFKNSGFENVDGFDGCEEFLNKAKERNFYKNLYCELLPENTEIKTIQPNTYDAVYSVGSFIFGHLTGNHLLAIINVVKPKGKLFIICTHYEDDPIKFHPTILKLQEEGIIKYYSNERVSAGEGVIDYDLVVLEKL